MGLIIKTHIYYVYTSVYLMLCRNTLGVKVQGQSEAALQTGRDGTKKYGIH